jgi:hypothetical protein
MDPTSGGSTGPHLCYSQALHQKQTRNEPSYHSIPGFVGHTLLTLTRSRFICHINQILCAMNKHCPHITGHCFCIGGTTFYLVSGVLPNIVKKFGCWQYQAYLEYWRCLDYLGAMHINMLPLKPQAQQQQRSLPKA